MKRKLLAFILMVTATLIVSAGGNSEKESETDLLGSIKIAGSSTVYPVSTAIAEEFNRIYPQVEIPIQSTGTGGGFKNFFTSGKTDINNASRPIKQSELEAARANGIEPVEFQVAIDGITVVVNPDADWVDNLTVEQLAHIWRPTNPAIKWSDVNSEWPSEKIQLYGPTSASGTFDYFTEAIAGEEGSSRSDYQGTEQDNTIVQAVAGSRYALGYFGLAYYIENQDKVKALKINGVKPSIESAKSGEYSPLSRPLFIYVNRDSLKREEVRRFVQFYLEKTTTDLIRQIGYVPLPEEKADRNMEKLNQILKELGE